MCIFITTETHNINKGEKMNSIKEQLLARFRALPEENKDCTNCANCVNCDDCVLCVGCTNCTNCVSCVGCVNSEDCVNSTNCVNCVNCILCVGLTDKKEGYWLLNEQVDKSTYRAALAALRGE
jgi:hypothetical protein